MLRVTKRKSTAPSLRPATAKDADWIKKLYAADKKNLGSFDLFMSWQNYLKGKGHFIVLPLIGFVRYQFMNKYQMNVVQEIAVDSTVRGQGWGRVLLSQVPVPVLLKCNSDNETGNKFYKAMGMSKEAITYTKKGVQQNIWIRTKPWEPCVV